MASWFKRQSYAVGRHRVRRLMRLLGLRTIYQESHASQPHPQHMIYPYLLRNLTVIRANQVWCTDLTYIPIKRGFLYLVAIMDWQSRKVLAWHLSNTMEVYFSVAAREEALAWFGRPDIFNTDQGSQFTSCEFISELKDNNIKILMNGKGRWIDNVFIERLWRSLKYECVYFHAFENGSQARIQIGAWLKHYNHTRPHSTFDGQTLNEVYNLSLVQMPTPEGRKHAA